jgi:hypothetical protein
MAEQTVQYDHIGSKYDEYARTATLKQAERYTFFRMVGALVGSTPWIWPVASAFIHGCSSNTARRR